MVDKKAAKELRELGMTYGNIAKTLGCSLDWCKVNLKGVSKNTEEAATIKELVKKAKSKQGVSTKEVWQSMKALHPNDISLNNKENKQMDTKNISRFKYKITKEDSTVIRPDWMQPKDARAIYRRVIEAVTSIDERVYEAVQDIIYEFDMDSSHIKGLTKTITELSYGGSLINPIDLSQRLENLQDTADELERRNSTIQEAKRSYLRKSNGTDPHPSSRLPSDLSKPNIPF
jgi:hypothetical protein